MRFLVDTNVLLDVLLDRKEFRPPAQAVWALAEEPQHTGLISTASVRDVFYFARKIVSREKAYDALDLMLGVFELAVTSAATVSAARAVGWQDFEDALQYFTASDAHAQALVTRNARDFSPTAAVSVFSPAEFLTVIGPLS